MSPVAAFFRLWRRSAGQPIQQTMEPEMPSLLLLELSLLFQEQAHLFIMALHFVVKRLLGHLLSKLSLHIIVHHLMLELLLRELVIEHGSFSLWG